MARCGRCVYLWVKEILMVETWTLSTYNIVDLGIDYVNGQLVLLMKENDYGVKQLLLMTFRPRNERVLIF